MVHAHVVTVVLNTNRRDDTLACLASLSSSSYPNHSVIVLDNQSVDGSVEAIQAGFPAVTVWPLVENRGYAGNNNVGIRMALGRGAEWVLVLNEDTILAPDCLERLAEAGEADPRIGVVGPTVYHHDEPGIIQSAGGTLDTRWRARHLNQNELDGGHLVAPRRVDWISGCAIMLRRAAIEQAGDIDERFFYYWEETEWCVRIARCGWTITHVPSAKLWHKGVQRNYRPGPSVTYYNTRNRFLMMSKHRAPASAWLLASAEIARTLSSWTLRPKWRDQRDHRDAMLRGAADFLRQRWGKMP